MINRDEPKPMILRHRPDRLFLFNYCPTCDGELGSGYDNNYCPYCGQRLAPDDESILGEDDSDGKD